MGVGVLCLSAAVTAIARWMNPAWTRAAGGEEVFHVGWVWFAMRNFGALFAVMTLMQIGPEVIGTVIRRPFRWIFRLPGRSAIDATASWMGAATLGVLITCQQYERGYYSQRGLWQRSSSLGFHPCLGRRISTTNP
jgi:nucleoside recognition membrane protein YjiH